MRRFLPGRLRYALVITVILAGVGSVASQAPVAQADFRFVILGDRTGGALRGAYAEAWREANNDHPDFVITVGDTIEGGDDNSVDAEWRHVEEIIAPYRKYQLFLVPGNHDIWSAHSAQAYQKYSNRPPQYSFNYRRAHFTILDNSQTETLSTKELSFLKDDLEANNSQSLKFVFFHRPFWLMNVLLKNPKFPLHELALRYGVRYIICGHLHEMLCFDLGPVTYISMASSGGHLREPKTYRRGWFYQHTRVDVHGSTAKFVIKELDPPFGDSRTSTLDDWGTSKINAVSSEN